MTWKKIAIVLVVIIGAIGMFSFRQFQKPEQENEAPEASAFTGIRYLALGDSYTIGQSVIENDRWPNQLVSRLQADGTNIKLVGNPSVTGYTSQDLIDRELPVFESTKPDFVTILIGVNDYVQGVDSATFTKNLKYILDTVQKQLSKPGAVVLVTIPDYGKTPSGARFGNPKDSEAGIKKLNQIIISEAQARNLPVADIFDISQQVSQDGSLVADDGLHPSSKQYTLWTDIIYKTITTSNILK